MKWKTRMTAEEAVLIALEIEDYGSLANAKSALSKLEDEFQSDVVSADEGALNESLIIRKSDEINRLYETLKEAHEIYNALLDDVQFVAYDSDRSHLNETDIPPLVLTEKWMSADGEGYVVPHKCTMTKQSLAEWFWTREKDMAKNIWPDILDKFGPSMKNDKPLATKTKNTYLRLIKVLSYTLIGETRGSFKEDADAVLKHIKSEGKNDFVVNRVTLQKYLEEAEDT